MSAGLRAVPLIVALFTIGLADASACGRRLTVAFTPDVPDPRDEGFLSSLLSNHVDYHLVFRGTTDDSNSVLDLMGPGPVYLCQEAIQTMSRDARVVSIQVQRRQQ